MRTKRAWRRRTYLLDGKQIDSHKVLGMLHTARKDKRDSCASCLKTIKTGQEYIQMLDYDPYIFHKECYLGDIFAGVKSPSAILGVSRKKTYPYGRHIPHLYRVVVECKRFKPEDLP